MLIVRAIRAQDLDGLMQLALQVGDGMTTLKPDAAVLGARVETAVASFAGRIAPVKRDYVFVMEDRAQNRIVGVCAIKAAVGLDEPFYNYRLGTLVHSSKELDVYSRMDTLYLSNDLTGCAELCSLFLHPDYRYGNNGRLLSKSRFLFIAQYPHLFEQKIIAEMRGFLNAQGRSPFWDSLGRHFFKMEFSRADDYSGLGKKSFIAELMPRHPLYVAYLPDEAQAAIGKVQNETAPAKRLLEQEGMYYEGYVDIFDAGPVLQARIAELRALRESTLARVQAQVQTQVHAQVEDSSAEPNSAEIQARLIANTSMEDFRILELNHPMDQYKQLQHDRVMLTTEQQSALNIQAGDTVRTMSLNPKKNSNV